MEPMEEELMAGLFGLLSASGVDPNDPRRRMAGADGEGGPGGGTSGAEMALARILPFILGMQSPNFAGPALNRYNYGGRGTGGGFPTQENRNAVGGPNVAPGAGDQMALDQPGASGFTPGAAGVAPPGQGGMPPGQTTGGPPGGYTRQGGPTVQNLRPGAPTVSGAGTGGLARLAQQYGRR